MKNPPQRYRVITKNLSVSGPLSEDSIQFLHDEGFRKIVTIAGGFVNPEVVPNLKKHRMELTHFPIDTLAPVGLLENQISGVLDKLVSLMKRESSVHLVCGPEMVETAMLVGIIRQTQCSWTLSGALSEALDICRFVDTNAVISAITNTEKSRWK
tara:strand:- start:831 stop:1295 length:465 start_codon:yes stop_codon:yes gene_type:complete